MWLFLLWKNLIENYFMQNGLSKGVPSTLLSILSILALFIETCINICAAWFGLFQWRLCYEFWNAFQFTFGFSSIDPFTVRTNEREIDVSPKSDTNLHTDICGFFCVIQNRATTNIFFHDGTFNSSRYTNKQINKMADSAQVCLKTNLLNKIIKQEKCGLLLLKVQLRELLFS